MRSVAPRIVNDVSCVTDINHVSFCVAGAVFGDLGASLFVAGAVFGEIWIDSRSAKCYNFQYKMRLRSAKSKLAERAGAR